jgi:biotin carboxyl carrier protein
MNGISNEDLRWLLELVEQEELAEIEVHVGESQVIVRTSEALASSSLRSQASEEQVQYGAELDEHHIPVLSPLAGVFYRGPSTDVDPFVATGDEVVYGDTVGLIEAMKLFNEIPAPATGVIGTILAEDGQRIAADEVLMIIET